MQKFAVVQYLFRNQFSENHRHLGRPLCASLCNQVNLQWLFQTLSKNIVCEPLIEISRVVHFFSPFLYSFEFCFCYSLMISAFMSSLDVPDGILQWYNLWVERNFWTFLQSVTHWLHELHSVLSCVTSNWLLNLIWIFFQKAFVLLTIYLWSGKPTARQTCVIFSL